MITSKSALIVEDDISLQHLYANFLKVLGIPKVLTANNGREAIEIFKNCAEKPPLILMDYRMPIKNGIETTKELLAIDPTIKVIFLSADDSIVKEARLLGVYAFLTKPFKFKELESVIISAFGNKPNKM